MLTTSAIRLPQFAARFAPAMLQAASAANWSPWGIGHFVMYNRRGKPTLTVWARRKVSFGPVRFEFIDKDDNDITAHVLRGLAQYVGPLVFNLERAQ